jgi:hypothetical protein
MTGVWIILSRARVTPIIYVSVTTCHQYKALAGFSSLTLEID